jgi:hypothetical protein
MLYKEIIAVCSEFHTKHINTLCGQIVELLNVKCGGTYSNHWALKIYHVFHLCVAVYVSSTATHRHAPVVYIPLL